MKLKPATSVSLLVALLCGQAFAQDAAPAPAPSAPATAPVAAPLADSLTGQAKSEYEVAKLLYADGDYAGAVLKFEHAYELSKDPRLLWNLAGTEKYLRHYARVETLLKQYVAAEGDKLNESDRAVARALLETMDAFLADVTLTVNQPDATVLVDDAEVGHTPLKGPLRLDMGTRKIRVQKPSFQEFSVTRNIEGGTKIAVDVSLVAETHEGRLRVSAASGDSIRVDGKIVGSGQWEGRVPSGAHRIEVSARGKQAWHSDSVVQNGQLTTVLVSLSANQAAPSGIPKWLWITGGAVVAAGLGTGSYFLFRPKDKGPPAAVDGSLGTVELPLRY